MVLLYNFGGTVGDTTVSWLTEAPVCDWTGVSCGDNDGGNGGSNNGVITAFNLDENGLEVSIPVTMVGVNLKHAATLNVFDNNLTGMSNEICTSRDWESLRVGCNEDTRKSILECTCCTDVCE